MRRSPAVFASIAILALGVASAQAQTARRYSLQASGLYVGMFGSAFDGVKDGVGLEVQGRYNPSAFSIGVGVQGSAHGMDFQGASQTVNFAGVFVEPRYVIDVGSPSAAPYAAARIAYLEQTADVPISGTTVHLSAGGTQLNLGGGVLLRLSPTINLDLGATFGAIHFADVKADVSGLGSQTFDTGSAGNGQNLVLRVGLAVGLGKR